MSAVGGRPDVPATWPGSPLLAKSGLKSFNNSNQILAHRAVRSRPLVDVG